MHPVSGYIIARDEDRSLNASVTCLLRYTDDLLLIHTGDLPELPKDERLRLVYRRQPGERYDFDQPSLRTWAMQTCFHPWILTIDGDELLTDENPDYYRNLDVPLSFPTYNLINLDRCILSYNHQDYKWYPDYHLRFFHRDDFSFDQSQRHCRLRLRGSGYDGLFCSEKTHVHVWHLHHFVKTTWNLDAPDVEIETMPVEKPVPQDMALVKHRDDFTIQKSCCTEAR